MASDSSKSTIRLGGIVKKIESPLAKYNGAGQLTCIICNVVVKTEMVWTAHINGRQHREKVLSLKKPKIEPQFAKPLSTTAIKRKAEPQNGSETLTGTSPSPSKKGVPVDFFDNNLQPPSMMTTSSKPIKSILKNSSKPSTPHQSVSDVSSTITSTTKAVDTHLAQPSVEMVPENSNSLPEGFFDDPKLDAKVRQIEFKDPVEEEWNKFQKEIHDEVTASVAIQEEDQEESTAERQLEEIEEQMAKWGRVIELEQKKEALTLHLNSIRQSMPMEEDAQSSSDEDAEMDGLFDWRSKAT